MAIRIFDPVRNKDDQAWLEKSLGYAEGALNVSRIGEAVALMAAYPQDPTHATPLDVPDPLPPSPPPAPPRPAPIPTEPGKPESDVDAQWPEADRKVTVRDRPAPRKR